MAVTLISIERAFDYDYYSRQKAPLETYIEVRIPYENVDKHSIAKFGSKIIRHGAEAIVVRVWEHNTMHWNLVHNWLSPEQAEKVRNYKAEWEK